MSLRQQEGDQLPTVGDTLRVVHRIMAPPGSLVQPRSPLDSMLATVVGVPLVEREGDSVRIAYTVAVWSPGRNTLTIPGPVVVHSNGMVDTLPASRVVLNVASVLPGGVPAESLTPRDARPWVERVEASALPLAVLVLPLALLFIAAALLWRRRGRPEPQIDGPSGDLNQDRERIASWRKAGEVALAIDHLSSVLGDETEAEEWRKRVRVVRFRPDSEVSLEPLLDEGLTLLAKGEGGE